MTVKGGKGMNERELREKFVNKAIEYIGSNEGGSKHKYIIDTYNKIVPLPAGYKVKYTDHWCATYVSCMASLCDMLDIIPAECSCNRMITLAKKMNIWVENDAYVPETGDIILYDWDDNGIGDNTGSSDHVGIVVSVSGNTMKIIEGNIRNTVNYRTIDVDAKYIRGYICPDFKSKATSKETITVKKESVCNVEIKILNQGSKGDSVKALQILLVGYGCSCGSSGADGSFGPATLKAVKAFQKQKGLVVDGSVGEKTWAALLGK